MTLADLPIIGCVCVIKECEDSSKMKPNSTLYSKVACHHDLTSAFRCRHCLLVAAVLYSKGFGNCENSISEGASLWIAMPTSG